MARPAAKVKRQRGPCMGFRRVAARSEPFIDVCWKQGFCRRALGLHRVSERGCYAVDRSMNLRDQQMKDANAIAALFSSYDEADEALRELHARGLRCDDGQLCARAAHRRTDARRVGPLPEMRARDRAE